MLLSPLYDLANSLSEGFFHICKVFFFVASHISSATSLMEPCVCLSVGKTEWVLTQILLFWQLSLLSSTTRAGWILIILSQQILHILKRLLRCFCICSFRCICFLYFGAFISPRRQKQIMRWALYQTLKKIHLKCIPVVCNSQISFLIRKAFMKATTGLFLPSLSRVKVKITNTPKIKRSAVFLL